MRMTGLLSFFAERAWLFGLFVFIILCLRYVIISGGPYLLAWHIFSEKLSRRKIQAEKQRPLRIKHEIMWSCISFLVFSVQAGAIYALYINGHTRLVTSWESLPALGHIAGLIFLLVIHDTYFYWMHRILHHRFLFRHIHSVHHQSVNPTPFAAFAFHPVEAFLEMAFLIPIILWMPLYVGTLVVFLLLSHFFNVIGHLGYEFFPRSTWTSWWGSWNTTSTHHNLHHQHVSTNYGLYCKWWDKLCGTLNPKTESEFFKIADRLTAERTEDSG